MPSKTGLWIDLGGEGYEERAMETASRIAAELLGLPAGQLEFGDWYEEEGEEGLIHASFTLRIGSERRRVSLHIQRRGGRNYLLDVHVA